MAALALRNLPAVLALTIRISTSAETYRASSIRYHVTLLSLAVAIDCA